MNPPRHSISRLLTMFSLMLAGEAIFSLPFHISRYFRPTFVSVFDVTQTELGLLGSTYGVVAMAAYLLGGGLADRYSARKLLTFSLLTTASTGLYLATIPSLAELRVLYALWGLLTILPFWSALIRATREWGGRDQQGEAFGILDGGRGFVAAGVATLAYFIFQLVFPADETNPTLEQKTTALLATIYMYTVTCVVAALFTWFFVPESTADSTAARHGGADRSYLWRILAMRRIWLHALIIACAYCTYKGIDFYSQYARDVWQWSEVRSAGLCAWSSWMRPVAAIGAGFVADRVSSSRVIVGCFVLTGATYLSFVAIPQVDAFFWLLWANVLVSCIGIFALRGIYFALLEETGIPHQMTGTAVGVVSFIGYSPEIFMPPLGGWLIDRWSGSVTGYNALFIFLAGASVVGMVATMALRHLQGQEEARFDVD